MAFLLSKFVRYLVILYILFSCTQYGLKWKSYTISPKEFKNIAAKSQGPIHTAVSSLTNDLRRLYGAAIGTTSPWISLVLGGHDFRALFLHASLTEYAAVIGSPLATSGRIGFHWSNSTCTVLSGVVTRSTDSHGYGNKESFRVGDNFRHGQFESHVYSFADETYAACYGRGFMPLSGVWTSIGAIARGEPASVFHLMYAYGQLTYDNMARSLMKTFNYYKSRATGKSEL